MSNSLSKSRFSSRSTFDAFLAVNIRDSSRLWYMLCSGKEGSGDQLEKLHSAVTVVITWGQGTHTQSDHRISLK